MRSTQHIKKMKVLLIEEIGPCLGDLLEKLHEIFVIIKGVQLPFGGIQVESLLPQHTTHIHTHTIHALLALRPPCFLVLPFPALCLVFRCLAIHCRFAIHRRCTAYSLPIHCRFTVDSLPIHLFTAYSLPIHSLFTPYSFPIHFLFNCLFTVYSLSIAHSSHSSWWVEISVGEEL
jgi:hypothetical protein